MSDKDLPDTSSYPQIFVTNEDGNEFSDHEDYAIKDEVIIKPNLARKDSQKSLSHQLKKVPSMVSISSHKATKKLRSHMTKEPIFDPFKNWSVFICILSGFLFLLDYVSDILVAISLRKDELNDVEETYWWFTFTITLIVVPAVIVNLFSLVWFHQDHILVRGGIFPRREKIRTKERIFLIVTHLLCLGPLIREFYIIRYGLKEKEQHKEDHMDKNVKGPYCVNHNIYRKDESKVDYYSIRKCYERDTAYLGVIDSFIQDAPQLVLQIYILSVRKTETASTTSTVTFQIVSVVTSLLSLSWTLVAFEAANRWANPEKPNISKVGNFFQFFWRFCIVGSRVLVLASFASIFAEEFFVFGGAHWLLMTMWIIMMGTNFCGSSDNTRRPLAELVYNIVVGWVFIFDIIHIKEGPTRLKYTVFYLLILGEMITLLIAWNIQIAKDEEGASWIHEEWYHVTLLTLVPCLFVAGLVFMIIFLVWNHPGGRMPKREQKASLF